LDLLRGWHAERKDRGGQLNSYTYDANNNLLTALNAAGITAADRSPMDVRASWDSLDRLTKVRSKEESSANYRFTTYAYDLNANVTRRDDDGGRDAGRRAGQRRPPQRLHYDAADLLTTQLDYGTSTAATDDQRITNTFAPTGWEASRLVARKQRLRHLDPQADHHLDPFPQRPAQDAAHQERRWHHARVTHRRLPRSRRRLRQRPSRQGCVHPASPRHGGAMPQRGVHRHLPV
jgi:hypothetical protein